MSEKKLMI